jgi:hypothetical protein
VSNGWTPGSVRGKKDTLVDVEQDRIRSGQSFDLRETVLEGGFDLREGLVSREESTVIHEERVYVQDWDVIDEEVELEHAEGDP